METTYKNLNELNKYEPELTKRLKEKVTMDNLVVFKNVEECKDRV